MRVKYAPCGSNSDCPGQTNQYLVGFLALAPAGIISAGTFFRP